MKDLHFLENKTILTGDRPTGGLHLGHLAGTLLPRVALQDHNDITILVADLQALTDHAGRADDVSHLVREIVLDYIAAGINPEQVTIVRQSDLPALAELTLLYMNLVTVPRLMRIPTIREESKSRGFGDRMPAGFLCYPVSQAADITGFDANLVPAGADQAPLIEITSEIVTAINRMAGKPVLRKAVLGRGIAPRLPGTDGSGKMSKSAGNAISIVANPQDLRAGVMSMFTDPGHLRVSDPGQVKGNVVFAMLDAFDSDIETVADLQAQYIRGGLGDMVLKNRLAVLLEDIIAPMRERRSKAAKQSGLVDDLLSDGARQGHEITGAQLAKVREAFYLGRNP